MEILLLILFFVIAYLYSSVGHGGASGYLALMALFSFEPSLMKPMALILNVGVSVIAFTAFYKGGFFRPKLLLPFVIGSIPMAYLGAKVQIDPFLYKVILAVFLLIALARIFYIPKNSDRLTRPIPWWLGLIIGIILGFFSGLIGIGGGIILSPLLIIFRWATIKEAAAVSAMFIFLNSISGLLGIGNVWPQLDVNLLLTILFAFVGGIAGSYSGSFRLNNLSLKYMLSVVLFIAIIKLIIT